MLRLRYFIFVSHKISHKRNAMTVSATQRKRGQSRNRNEYHRLRYNNLSAKKKAERSKQVRKSLENKISNLDSTELIQYKELKKQRDSKYYYNKKVKSLMKDLQELNLNAVPSISSTVFGTRRSIVHVPEYINGLYRSIGNNILPGGCSGCYVSSMFFFVILHVKGASLTSISLIFFHHRP